MTDEAVHNPPPDRPQITVSLTYDDVEGAARWLCEVFGFTELAETRVEWEGKLVHAELALGERGLIMLGPPFADRASPRTRGGTTTMINAYVEDVDTHFAHAKEAGARRRAGGHLLRRPDLPCQRPGGSPLDVCRADRRHPAAGVELHRQQRLSDSASHDIPAVGRPNCG